MTCNRCPVITINPETGEKTPDLEPLKTLRAYRLMDPNAGGVSAAVRKAVGESPMFMTNYSLVQEGNIEVGDEVWAQI